MKTEAVIPHLFRTEYSKIVAVLVHHMGIQCIEEAEDIAGDTFLLATESWPYNGVPANPPAWLYTVAKNKAKNQLSRTNLYVNKVLAGLSPSTKSLEDEIDLSEKNIADSQLQMLFAVCHPSIGIESQIALALRILCGFGIDEIADAFYTSKDVINKRLYRAKEKLRELPISLVLDNIDNLSGRLSSVLKTIYLLFNEGYYSQSNTGIIRKELCAEAINLAYLLRANPITNTHATNSLLAMMCFQSSRFDARLATDGSLILYEDQDESLWDRSMIEYGFHYLKQASLWEEKSKYYIEASIAYWHTIKADTHTKWSNILKLYDVLIIKDSSPMIVLSRIYALSKVNGNEAAIIMLESLEIPKSQYYYLVLSELYKTTDSAKALSLLGKALDKCKSEAERQLIVRKISAIDQ